ncbi:hypothetical protein E4K64_13215 [Bradyrhizobium frederickii]|uniref:Uncharacterized protein n=1 Tax=Bradyrhizobium frederickii TaxID=2560054 RepID=A0A4Y9P8E7_9BRAD|nr:hypothetical protein [Bradyrhizobium frederickii]TFV76524.1 hypothetical protein E4K64_13215 [Bradyrhizobium frederickii]
MNLRASIVATCVGAAFFGAGYMWNYQPDIVNPDEIWSMFQSEHRRARAAVSRVLIEPHSAHFRGLRTVEADAARYVCGVVNAKNRAGHAIDAAFVYAVASDFARVDDDGRITSQHFAYKSCPTATEVRTAEQQMPVTPGALAVAKAVGKVIPPSSGGTMEQQLGQLAARTAAVAPGAAGSPGPVRTGPAGTGPAPAGQPSVSQMKPVPDSEPIWQADRPPVAWPAPPSGQCPAKSTQERTAAEALAVAKEIEARWEQSRTLEAPTKRVSSEEIKRARCALLAIDPADKDYPQAWAAFVRLRNIERDLAG